MVDFDDDVDTAAAASGGATFRGAVEGGSSPSASGWEGVVASRRGANGAEMLAHELFSGFGAPGRLLGR